jgi:hypothetical protein
VYAALAERYDFFGNVNTYALDTNADAIAAAVITFAYDTSMLPPRVAPTAALRTAAGPGARTTANGQLLD